MWLSVVQGVCNFSVPYALVYWAETRLSSGLVSVLWSVFPLLTAIGAHLTLPEERLFGRQWLGLVGGFLGVTLMLATDVRAAGPEAFRAGLLLLLSPLVSAVGTNLIKRRGGGVSSADLNRNGMFVGALLTIALALTLERGAPRTWSGPALLSILYLSVVGTVVTFGLYFWLLRHAPGDPHEPDRLRHARGRPALSAAPSGARSWGRSRSPGWSSCWPGWRW